MAGKARKSIAIAGLVCLFFSVNSCKFGKHQLPILGPFVVENGDTIYRSLPEFQFVNQDSQEVKRSDLIGKVVVADFFFISCPTICPTMTKNLKKVYDRYAGKEDFFIISHSIDTKYDTVPRLKAYAERLNVATDSWNFVTGERDSIFGIAQNFYMSTASEDSDEPGGLVHSGHFILLDRKGRIRGLYDGTDDASVGRLIADLKLLLHD